MQKDFHYHCVGVITKAAGFSSPDALTIAYASQYVDDSTESEPIRDGDLIFDPVRTAHLGLKAYEWPIQKKVYIPFHFIPPEPMWSPGDTFATIPDSRFARMILEDAGKEQHEPLRLYRIGVALHTFADTWSHQGFSGREHKENDVESIEHREGKKWKHLLLENIYLDVLPQIGHTEADYFPDQPFLRWRYTKKETNEVIERNNTKDFLKAAKTIYDQMFEVEWSKSETPIPWKQIEPGIQELLAYREKDVEIRCERWRERFQGMFEPSKFEYDKLAWRNEALEPRHEAGTNWDDFKPSDFERLKFRMKPGFYDSRWVHFHRAALRQRHFVLEKLL